MESDLKISVTKFEPGNFSDGATEFVKRAKNAALSFPPWYEVLLPFMFSVMHADAQWLKSI